MQLATLKALIVRNSSYTMQARQRAEPDPASGRGEERGERRGEEREERGEKRVNRREDRGERRVELGERERGVKRSDLIQLAAEE